VGIKNLQDFVERSIGDEKFVDLLSRGLIEHKIIVGIYLVANKITKKSMGFCW